MGGVIKTSFGAKRGGAGDQLDPPVEILRPVMQAGPYVFASPHSGRLYPDAFLRQSALDPLTLRASEDAYVDELFLAAPELGAPLLLARFPRAYLDANREAWELDPTMFDGPLPAWVNGRTPRVAAGLGAVPRIVADGAAIYPGPIPFADAEERVRRLHLPYHRALERLLAETRAQFGRAILVDCHSMPAPGGSSKRERLDIVLGDRFGSSCAPSISDKFERGLTRLGLKVARNAPYAGGYSTERYGRPSRGLHAIQIEISRGLYLDEPRVERAGGFADLRAALTAFMGELLDAPRRRAAE